LGGTAVLDAPWRWGQDRWCEYRNAAYAKCDWSQKKGKYRKNTKNIVQPARILLPFPHIQYDFLAFFLSFFLFYGCPAGEFSGLRFSANNLCLQCENKMATEHGQSAGLSPFLLLLAHLLFDLCFSHSKNSRWFFSFRFHQIANAVNSEKRCAKYAFLFFSPCSYLSHIFSIAKKKWRSENYLFRLDKQTIIELAQ